MFCIVPCSGERMTVVGSRVDIRFMTLEQLIARAYRIRSYQLAGPDWMRAVRFDIEAKIPDGASKEQAPEMLQTLLAERFRLTLHPEKRERPVYALMVGKNGVRLREAGPAPKAPAPGGGAILYTPRGEGRTIEGGGFEVNDAEFGSVRGGRGPGGVMKFEFQRLAMSGLADLLTPHLDRPVVDRTGLKGSYYLAVENRPRTAEEGQRKGGPQEAQDGLEVRRLPDPFGDGLLAAIAKAGLELKAARAPVEMLVVDHVEKAPAAN